MLFLGSWRANRQRTRYLCIRMLRYDFQARLEMIDDLWDEDAYTSLIRGHDIFLNIHKTCGDPDNPVTFRVAKILNSGGLVVSERSFSRDEIEYDGLVDFVSPDTRDVASSDKGASMAAVARRYLWVANLSSVERRDLGVARRQLFRVRFDPVRIFQRAGVYDLLSSRVGGARLADPHAPSSQL